MELLDRDMDSWLGDRFTDWIFFRRICDFKQNNAT